MADFPEVTADELFNSARIGPDGGLKLELGETTAAPSSPEEEDSVESTNLFMASRTLGMLQTKPMDIQHRVLSEFAAKYLPGVTTAFRKRRTPNNAPQLLINYVAYTPYFLRFSMTADGADLARIQAKRMAHGELLHAEDRHTTIAEMCQFLSTLFVVYQLDFDHVEDREPLLARLKVWRSEFRGRFAEQTTARCIDMLEPDTRSGKEMVMKMCAMRMTLGLGVDMCAIKSCRSEKGGAELLQCSRCKTTRYCGVEHQRQDWLEHKSKCFRPSF